VWFASQCNSRVIVLKDGLDFEHDACSRQKQKVSRLMSTRATNPLIMTGFWRQYRRHRDQSATHPGASSILTSTTQ
jgi:hypothetical protein